ncbi:MAG: DUF971 domain-containing protein [Gammaproteobacteria bacterium]|nr:DUF971 domain-containing protein [Gammaproteobacteria bacterium]
MSKTTAHKTPVEINLHSKSRLLAITFNDGKRFELPCEYLRVFSRAKEVRTMEQPVVGKEQVNITQIEPQGDYAIRLTFDDGHDTGIYSWDSLYELGDSQKENWQNYLARLDELGHTRNEVESGPKKIKIMYFTYLVEYMRKEAEETELPEKVTDVLSLLDWLRWRNPDRAHLFADSAIQVTVNKQFSEPFTKLSSGDEVAIIPTSPITPAAEKK